MDPDSLARDVAKWLLESMIAIKTTQLVATTVDDYTRFEKDSLPVRLGSGAVGMVVSRKLEPVTDKIVNSTADFINEKRADRRTKKDAKKKDK